MNKLLNSIWLKSLANERTILWLLVAYGIGTSLIQFFANQSLWPDEASLALNIIHRSPAELLKPLDHQQSAPPLFLLIEKLFSTLVPNSEYGLRLLPLLCFWMALFLFVRIVRKQHNGYVCIMAVTLFVTSRMFSWYSCEVKQYMTEMFVFLAIFWLSIKDYNKWQTKYWALGIAGIIAVFMANVTPIIMATFGLYLCYKLFTTNEQITDWREKKCQIYTLALVFVGWLIAVAFYYYFFVHEHPLTDFMIEFWSGNDGFLIVNPFDTKFLPSIKNVFRFMFSAHLYLSFPAIGNTNLAIITVPIVIGLYVAGIKWMIKRSKIEWLILYCLPILLHLGMSTLKIYPAAARLILYTGSTHEKDY